jgi:hypothetical protein
LTTTSNRNKFLAALVLLLFANTLVSQTNSVSPYSRFGFGDLYHGLNARYIGMGGASLATPDGLNINFANPASLVNLEMTTFNVGFEGSFIAQQQESPSVTIQNSRSGMRNLSVGVPIKEWWGSAASLQPYSFKGYDISSSRSLTNDTTVSITDQFTGEGGLNSVIWANGFEVAEGFSLGINMHYIFGSLRESNTVNFDNFNFLDTRSDRESQLSDWYFSYALNYQYQFENDRFLAVAARFQNTNTINSQNLQYDYTLDGSNARDTLLGGSTSDGVFTMPSEFGFGLSYGKQTENALQAAWAINADYETYAGSEFNSSLGGSPLSDGYKMELGGFFTPRFTFKSLERGTNFFNNTEYRFGGFYEKTPISLAGQDIYNYGITFGLGLPIRQRNLAPGEYKVSTVNLGIVAGRRGTFANNLIREEYISLYMSVTFNDKWFIEYKYR